MTCATGKDVFWYTRGKQDGSDPVAAEVQSVKEREEELMLEVRSSSKLRSELRQLTGGGRLHHFRQLSVSVPVQALGMKPKVKKLPVQPKLDQRELAQLTQAGEDEDKGLLAAEDRVKGIGYQPYVPEQCLPFAALRHLPLACCLFQLENAAYKPFACATNCATSCPCFLSQPQPCTASCAWQEPVRRAACPA